ncbi:MAG: NusG domain II-containing protein [Eubacterium sp.]|nr:NusG domain II-containing protein [Eubacterium sp.]
MKKKLLRKWDIILITAALLAAGVFLLCINVFSTAGEYAVVEVNGETVVQLSLAEDTVYDIEIENEVTNTLKIENGEAKMISADCPDKICVNHRSISKNNESIICLPNKVIITIVSDAESDIDGVAK